MPNPSPMQGFIANVLGLAQNRRAEEQLALAQATAKAEALTRLQTMAQLLTNPASREALGSMFSRLTGDSGAVQDILTGTPTNLATQGAASVSAGRAAMSPAEGASVDRTAATTALTGQTPLALAQANVLEPLLANAEITPEMRAAFLSRLVSGLTPGQMTLDVAQAEQPKDEVARALRISQALELSPQQVEQNTQGRIGLGIQQQSVSNQRELGFANLRQDERALLINSTLQEAELGLRRRTLDLQGGGAIKPLEIQQEITGILKLIQQGRLNPEDRERLFMNIKQYGQVLVENGQAWAKPYAEIDPKKAAKDAFTPGVINNLIGPN